MEQCRNFICKERLNDTECQNVSKSLLVLQIYNRDSPIERELYFLHLWFRVHFLAHRLWSSVCTCTAEPWNPFILSFRSLLSPWEEGHSRALVEENQGGESRCSKWQSGHSLKLSCLFNHQVGALTKKSPPDPSLNYRPAQSYCI